MTNPPVRGWTPSDKPWARRTPGPYLCYFCGNQTAAPSWTDIRSDPGRVEIYCDSPDCEAREIAVIVMRDGEYANRRADVRALDAIDDPNPNSGSEEASLGLNPHRRAEIAARRTTYKPFHLDVQ